MRWLPIILIALLTGCPNENAPSANKAEAAHPWDLATWQSPFPEPEGGYVDPGHPKRAVVSGTQMAEHDSFNPAFLTGSWLQLALVSPAGIERRPIEAMHRIDFTPNGKLVYHAINDGVDKASGGTWEKTGPEVMYFELDKQKGASFDFIMNKENFFFFFGGSPVSGYWFAKIPDVFSETIMQNRFQTNLGELHLTDVVGNSFSGTVEGATSWMVSGVYNSGVLLLDWVDPATGNSGMGAFIVDSDWSGLDGVWWINSFEAAPFGGEWISTSGLPDSKPEV